MEVQFICETPFKDLRKSWDSPEEVLRKSWESPESPEKVVRKSWEGPEKVLIKSEKVLIKSEKVLSKVLRREWTSPKEVWGRTEKVLKKYCYQKVIRKSSKSHQNLKYCTSVAELLGRHVWSCLFVSYGSDSQLDAGWNHDHGFAMLKILHTKTPNLSTYADSSTNPFFPLASLKGLIAFFCFVYRIFLNTHPSFFCCRP